MAAIEIEPRDNPPENWPENYVIRSHCEGGKFSWALYSPDELYRYRLRRVWAGGRRLAYVMLNPSTASELKNDPTVERCERRARALGYGGFEVVNIFALRSTDPKGLYQASDPVGAMNDQAIAEAVKACDEVLCAWGAHGDLLGRGEVARAQIAALERQASHLGLTKAGHPKHPLYIGYAVKPKKWLELS